MGIQIKKNTKKRLAKLGIISQNYDDIVLALIKHAEVCDNFWNDR
jgi:hypothetical protein